MKPIQLTNFIFTAATLTKILLSCLLLIVSFLLIPPSTALALSCNDCLTHDDPNDSSGNTLSFPDGWNNPVMKNDPATSLDVPDSGESVPAVLDGDHGFTVSTPTRTAPDSTGTDSTGTDPDSTISQDEAKCRVRCHNSTKCLMDC